MISVEAILTCSEDTTFPTLRIVVMVEEGYDFAYETGWCFKKTAVQRDGSVFVDSAGGALPEGILHILRGLTDEMDMLKIAGKRCLFG